MLSIIARDKHTTDVMQVKITDGSTGYDYHVIFDRCLDDSITSVEIDDPYIRNPHQVKMFPISATLRSFRHCEYCNMQHFL